MAPKVKICGLTNLDDARRAADLGAWALGLIFHEPSPRACAESDALEIAAALHRRALVCGVFVNRPLGEVVAAADRIGLTMLQLHGDEGPAYCAEAARRTGCRVIKAVQVRSQADLRAVEAFHTDFHMLDAHAPGLRGGTGETFDWELLRGRRTRVPVILSGGLTPANVAEGVAIAAPYAVDVASGVEAEPGRKDPARLEAFFSAAREGSDPGRASMHAFGPDPERAL
jgi:phosphoribosylanthranilate isomerase